MGSRRRDCDIYIIIWILYGVSCRRDMEFRIKSISFAVLLLRPFCVCVCVSPARPIWCSCFSGYFYCLRVSECVCLCIHVDYIRWVRITRSYLWEFSHTHIIYIIIQSHGLPFAVWQKKPLLMVRQLHDIWLCVWKLKEKLIYTGGLSG